MRLTVLIALAIFTGIPAKADTRADVTALIRAGNAEAALAATRAPDATAQRGAFSAFDTSHPDVGAASAVLLAAHPGDAHAMVARGWHVLSLGWAMRGTAPIRSVYPEARERMSSLHAEARALAKAAIAEDPSLLPASDLMILAARTSGDTRAIDREFARIMPLAPNRHTLLLAAGGMTPAWGGPPGWGENACQTWAGKIADVADYSTNLCGLDLIFNASSSRQDHQAAFPRLAAFSSPILDGARREHVLSGLMPTDETIAALKAMQNAGELDLRAAQMLDSMLGKQGVGPATRKVLSMEIPRLRTEADFNPGNVFTIGAYVDALYLQSAADDTPVPIKEVETRYAHLFALAPYDGDTWLRYAFLLDRGINYQTVALDRIDEVRSYIVNGVFYTNHAASSLAWLDTFNRTSWDALDRRNVDAVDRTGATAFPKAEFEASIICPTIRAIRMLEAVCAVRPGSEGCPGADDPTSPWPALMARAEARGACEEERTAPAKALAYTPVPVSLPEEG